MYARALAYALAGDPAEDLVEKDMTEDNSSIEGNSAAAINISSK